jgi:hypothetical protein
MFYENDGSFVPNNNVQNFIQTGKDLQLIMEKLVTNDNICKLLYYTGKDALSQPALTPEVKLSMINEYIKVVPVLPKDIDMRNYILVQFDNFSPSSADPMNLIDFILTFDIFCNSTNWILDDYLLRPYAIMHEIDKMFGLSKLNSSGPINFIGANSIIINENLLGFTVSYRVHDYR